MAAYAVDEMVCENMASAARVHAVERGKVVGQHTLIAFGGAAPLHAARVAEKLGVRARDRAAQCRRRLGGRLPAAPIAYELVRSRYMRLDASMPRRTALLAGRDGAEAHRLVAPGARGAPFERRVAFMRYVGQGHEIAVELPRGPAGADAAGAARGLRADYAVLFERPIPNAAIEILSWSVQVSTEAGCRKQGAPPAVPQPAPVGKRPVFDGRSGEHHRGAALSPRAAAPGERLPGPAVIAEDETSTYMFGQLSPRISTPAAASSWTARTREDHEPVQQRRPVHRPADHVEPPDRGGRGAGADADAHRLQPDRARMRRPLGRRVRPQGRMLAQAVTGTPGHVNSMAESVKHFMRHFPLETMKPGDAYITNDPWMGTGHLNDFVITTPCFRNGKLVALFSCTSHLMDIGGIGFGPDATDVFMEGLYIPMLKLIDQGKVNETLMAMIRANTRLPIDTEGDVYSLAGLQRRRRQPPGRDDGRVRHRRRSTARRSHHAPARARPCWPRSPSCPRAPGATR